MHWMIILTSKFNKNWDVTEHARSAWFWWLVDFCNKYVSSLWLMLSPWIIRSLTLTPLLASLVPCNFRGTINPPYTFLKTATIPTCHGIFIDILWYISMQLSTVLFIMTRFIIVILLFAWSCSWHRICGKATFIIFIHVTLDSLHIPVHHRRHSYRVISCSSFEL